MADEPSLYKMQMIVLLTDDQIDEDGLYQDGKSTVYNNPHYTTIYTCL